MHREALQDNLDVESQSAPRSLVKRRPSVVVVGATAVAESCALNRPLVSSRISDGDEEIFWLVHGDLQVGRMNVEMSTVGVSRLIPLCLWPISPHPDNQSGVLKERYPVADIFRHRHEEQLPA
uniref:Uncharacterized protein n=1 Tax=Arundo donax TaxID=35708 RepID=A0A0A8ZY53_ARUDO